MIDLGTPLGLSIMTMDWRLPVWRMAIPGSLARRISMPSLYSVLPNLASLICVS